MNIKVTHEEDFETVWVENEIVAEVLWHTAETSETKFYSSPESPLQMGIIFHEAGYVEPAHRHPNQKRQESETQQYLVLLNGIVEVDFFTRAGLFVRSVTLRTHDSILIKSGVHRIRIHEQSKCLTLKQGPFTSLEKDKIFVDPT